MVEYIEREAAYREICSDENMSGYEKAYCSELIRNIHASNVAQVRHGDWEIVSGSNGNEYMVCTCCRVSQDLTGVFTYCPNCGARMDEFDT